MGRTTAEGRLQKAFTDLGAAMKKDSCGLYIIEYNSMSYFLELDEKEGAFCILQTVRGYEGKLSESEFDTVLDVIRNFHKEYNIEWNEGLSYLYSPWYPIQGTNEPSSKSLKKIIEDFFEAWSFACANAYLIKYPLLWK